MISMGLAALATGISGVVLLPILRRLKAEQTILQIGPAWHNTKKGTPTMGGLMFIAGMSIAVVAGIVMLFAVGSAPADTEPTPSLIVELVLPFALGLGLGAVGFIDDMLKVCRKQNEGLTSRQKLLLQVPVAVVYLICLQLKNGSFTILFVPPFGSIDLGYMYYVFAIFAILATANAVNFTDGVDGLLSSVTAVVGMGFMAVSAILGSFSLQLASSIMIGGCIGFLYWNMNPAKVFMGDTGSMFLSGIVLGLAFGNYMPMLILPLGIIYVVEMLSVVIQMLYFKATGGRRLFKMTPIHHSFEMSGYSEKKIVRLFCIVSAIGAIIGIVALKIMLSA